MAFVFCGQMAKVSLKKIFIEKLSIVYRLVVLNDDTLEEVQSVKLTPLSLYALGSGVLVAIIALVVSLIVFTPLKEYIPGYADVKLRRDIVKLNLKADTLESLLTQQNSAFESMKKVALGEVGHERDTMKVAKTSLYDEDLLTLSSKNDSILKSLVQQNITVTENQESAYGLILTNPFSGSVFAKKHSEKDLVWMMFSSKAAVLLSPATGTIINSGYEASKGFFTLIQLQNGIICHFYHLGQLMVSDRQVVNKGNSFAEISPNQTVMFEMWYKGIQLDPSQYIK